MTAAEQYADANRVLGEMRAVMGRGVDRPWSFRAWSDFGEEGRMVVAGGHDCYVVAEYANHANGPLITLAVNALGPMLDGWEAVLRRHAPRMAGSRGPFCFACHTVTVASAPHWPCADARAVLGALGIEVGT